MESAKQYLHCASCDRQGSKRAICASTALNRSPGEPLKKGVAALKCEWMPDLEKTLDDSMDPDDMFDPFATCKRTATRASVDSTIEDHRYDQNQRDERQASEEGIDGYPSEQSVQFVSIIRISRVRLCRRPAE